MQKQGSRGRGFTDSSGRKTGFKGSRIRGFEWKKDRVQGVKGSRMQVEERKGSENSMGKMYYAASKHLNDKAKGSG